MKFTSIKEVKIYLSGDRITCLICKKSHKHLGSHIAQEYKRKTLAKLERARDRVRPPCD